MFHPSCHHAVSRPTCGLFAMAALAIQACASTNAVVWQQTGWGGGGFFWAAAHHPTNAGVLYMAGDCCGVYRSEDQGRNWRIINDGLASYAVYTLAVGSSHPERVFAATEEGLCRSDDGGGHWRLMPQTGRQALRITGERNVTIRSIAVDPLDDDTLYAASPGGTICKSQDGGETWATVYRRPASPEEAGALRVQYGKVTGDYYGDIAWPVSWPTGLQAQACTGVGFSFRAEGNVPKDSFLILRTAAGTTYRSRNLAGAYAQSGWQDLVLQGGDFALDPDYLKQHPGAVASPVGPEWSAIIRVDLTCSGALPTAATVLHLRTFFLTVAVSENGEPLQAGTPPRRLVGRDFGKVPPAQTFGSLRLGPPPGGPIHSVSVAPSDHLRVMAATDDDGLVLSRDGGKSWRPLSTPRRAASATFDSHNPDVIYGAFFTNGIMRSSDAGKTWVRLSRKLSSKCAIIEVAVSPANPLDLYAIGSDGWNGSFYLSNDGGETWRESSTMAVDRRANPTLDGLNAGTAHLSAPKNMVLNPLNPREIFIAANWRSCLSTDGGVTWMERDSGADISCITDIRFHGGKTYVTAMDEGSFVSDDDGRTWRQLWPLRHTPGLSGHNWRIAVTGSGESNRIVATVSPWYKTPTCVVHSDDGGQTFRTTQAGLPDYIIRPNTMWGQGHPRALAVDPNDSQILYLGIDGDPADGKSGGGLFKSCDGGSSWAQLPSQPASRRMFYGLAVDPADSSRLFWGACGAGGGVYRSEDGGASWTQVFRNENFVWNVLATTGGVTYASGQQLWRSTDHGTTWKQLTHFAEKRSIVGLEVHPGDPRTVWISAVTWGSRADGAVYRTTDGGVTWQEITGNLPFVMPEILRFNPATQELWAGWVGLYKTRQGAE